MIGRRGKLVILLYVVFLTVLFLMCSTDLIIREPEREIYQIAVIIEDARDDNYGNFRKGMDQAAMEFHADVHFITLYEKMDGEQQMELMSREQQDGADAIILAPANEDQVIKTLAAKQAAVPVVLLGSGLMGEGAAGAVVADYREMGEKLAKEIVKAVPKECQMFMFVDPGYENAVNRLFLEGAQAVLERDGRSWEIVEGGRDQGFHGAIQAVKEKTGIGGQAVILAESPEILTSAAAILADSQETWEAGCVLRLYGRGSTLSILNYLDRGLITGICATDDFGIGYLSVRTAVQALEGGGSQSRITMDSYYIEKEDLRKPEYEKLLFPVE